MSPTLRRAHVLSALRGLDVTLNFSFKVEPPPRRPFNGRRAGLDHIHPVARGGATVLENLQPAHPSCNLRKGARVMEGA